MRVSKALAGQVSLGMMQEETKPITGELPGDFAERLGKAYAAGASAKHKKEAGQFFTPVAIGRLMASLIEWPDQPEVRLLDPGCGVAVLACCAVEQLVSLSKGPHKATIVAYDTDTLLLPFALQALEYAKNWAGERGAEVHYTFDSTDFLVAQGHLLSNQPQWFQPTAPLAPFDVIITNPPYFKLNKEDARVKAAARIVDGQPNIYALFLSVAAELAAPAGQLITITPRSFAAGRYFRAFRHHFFRLMNLRTVHLFTSRREAFERDSVLQETVIMRVVRESPQPTVTVSESTGIRDITTRHTDQRPMAEVLNRATKEWMLYLPSGEEEKDIIQLFRQWPDTLASHGLRISTGPVVAFRTRDYLQSAPTGIDSEQAPLFWMHNVLPMRLNWPDPKPAKEQYLSVAPETRAVLRPNKTCVLLRRFSAKDDKSRLVAAPYLAPGPYGTPFVGFENKLNYLYRAEGSMPAAEATGLAALLNSRLFDSYFRTFNGNTNVSATELRDMPLPSLDVIRALGEQLLADPFLEPDQLITDALAFNSITLHAQ